jgi:hypothetical protein
MLFFDETEVMFASPEATGANAYGAVRNSRTPDLWRPQPRRGRSNLTCGWRRFDRGEDQDDGPLLRGLTHR